jgi:hypothetical protein
LSNVHRPSGTVRRAASAFLLAALAFSPARPAEAARERSRDKHREKADDSGFMAAVRRRFVESDKMISAQFDRIAEGIDVFLAGASDPTIRNETRVSIENSTYSAEGQGSPINSTDLKVGLHLPNLEKSWQLKFTTYDEIEEDRRTEDRHLQRAPREKNYGASLAFFKKLGDVRVTFQPRVQLDDPLKVAHYLKFESEAESKELVINPKLQFFARPDKGTGVFGAFNFTFKLTEIFSLTFINEGEYEDRLNKFSTSNGFSLGQRLTEKMFFAHSLIFDGNNRPNHHLESYTLASAFNHLWFKNVLHYRVTPLLGFAKTYSWKGHAGLVLTVSLIF